MVLCIQLSKHLLTSTIEKCYDGYGKEKKCDDKEPPEPEKCYDGYGKEKKCDDKEEHPKPEKCYDSYGKEKKCDDKEEHPKPEPGEWYCFPNFERNC